MKAASFSNATMREPIPRKPHIALIDGRWRVSPWKRKTGDLYYKAHAFARWMNMEREMAEIGARLICMGEE